MEIDTLMVEQIHRHIYQDTYQPKEKPYANFAYQLEAAIRLKDFKYLMLVLGSGKGFNDKSKEVFCDIVGIKRSYLLKDMKAAISNHCSISVEAMDLHYDYYSAKSQLDRKRESLRDAFANGDELISIVDNKFANGYTRIIKVDRRTYLANPQNMGWHLQRVPLKEYAIAKVEYETINKLYSSNPELHKDIRAAA